MMHDMPMDPHMPMEDMCQMNMVFTWEWRNSCVIYEWWHVKTAQGFVATFVVLTLLSVLYEYLRFRVTQWRIQVAQGSSSGLSPGLSPGLGSSLGSSLSPCLGGSAIRVASTVRVRSAILYAVQVGYSFMLMLVFMTYNGWYMMAVVLGAGLGFYVWGDLEPKSLVCH